MVKVNGKALLSDKNHLNNQWDDLMKELNEGKINKERAVYLMDRLNAIDRFLMAQGMRNLI